MNTVAIILACLGSANIVFVALVAIHTWVVSPVNPNIGIVASVSIPPALLLLAACVLHWASTW